ncbi:DNA gyrase/topoisomerase subunit a [Babesia gibsoni]|uniref:DNA topoisomerase (ATP-hydrolyzing) n=1 Tax=Babesia gibsoni TaxID=33632 RepID=A0AAD8LGJ9_BABGI|nr:DNA gyrase/topoisomerase subunit a [Babesia gibsoni]
MRLPYRVTLPLWISLALHVFSGISAFRNTNSSEPLRSSFTPTPWSSQRSGGTYPKDTLCATESSDAASVSQDSTAAGGSDGGNVVTLAEGSPHASSIEDLELCDEISDSFMKYALSIILGRALPDARDGLKVVHRRILWAMQDLKLSATTPYRKCAKVVGDVLGKYHPHSDKSVYDALCRLSQKFMMRVPLVDGHGNFGSADDPPAAMRYTECRLSHFSDKLLLPDIASETVDMLPNFDSTELEPTVLPAKIPMLLINGSSGIAVGLATSIPPHNPDEIISAAIIMARNYGDVDPETLLQVVRGPDFPTGGHINTTMDNLRKIYTTGKGSLMLQAKFVYEERIKPRNSKKESDVVVNTYTRLSQLSFSAGSRASIIVTELPYNVRLRDVMMSISKAVDTGSIRGISDLRDESDRSGIRLVIDLKKQITTHIEAEEILSKLKRMSGLCSFFKCNFIALGSRGTKPVRLTLHSALKIWLDFRVQTIRKRTVYFLRRAKERLNIVRGFIVASDHIDEIVRMIRSSASPSEARKTLMEKRFGGLNSEQANAVMRMTLSQLSKVEREKLENEEAELKATVDEYNKLLNDEHNIYELICRELQEIQQQPRRLYGSRRRFTSMSVSGRQKVPLSSILSPVLPPQGTKEVGKRGVTDGGEAADLYSDSEEDYSDEPEGDESDKESDEDISEHTDPTLIVINNFGWIQRIKLDNMFFTSGRARSIYSPRVYQAQAAQYSIDSEKAAGDTTKESIEETVTLKYGVGRPKDIAVLMGSQGMCLIFPISKLRLCNRGYSIWKALDLDRTERISHFMVTDKLVTSAESGGGGEIRRKITLANPNDYLVVGFADGSVNIIRGKVLESSRGSKSGINRVRLWKREKSAPVFSMLAAEDDDLLVTTQDGMSIRVCMRELVVGLENRAKTQMKVMKLKDGDRVTCGVLLEGPFDEVSSATEDGDKTPQNEGKEKTDAAQWLEATAEEPPPSGKHVILLSERGKGKLIPISELKPRHYGGSGYNIMRLSDDKEDALVSAVPVVSDDHVLLVSKDGLLAQKDPFALRSGLRHHKMRNFWVRMSGGDSVRYAVRI